MTILRYFNRFLESCNLSWKMRSDARKDPEPVESALDEIMLYTWEEKRNAVADICRELPEDSEHWEQVARDFVEIAHRQYSADENPDKTVVVWIET